MLTMQKKNEMIRIVMVACLLAVLIVALPKAVSAFRSFTVQITEQIITIKIITAIFMAARIVMING